MAIAAQSDAAASPARSAAEDLPARPAPVANVAVANVGQVGFSSRFLPVCPQQVGLFQKSSSLFGRIPPDMICWGPSFAVQQDHQVSSRFRAPIKVSNNLSEEGNKVMRPIPVRSIKKVVRTSTRVVHTGAGTWGSEIFMLQYMT